MSTITNQLKKHGFLILFGSVFFILLLITGLVVSHYFNDSQLVNKLPDPHSIYFFCWRILIYSLFIIGWKPLIHHIFRHYQAIDKAKKIQSLLTYQKKLIVYSLIFEIGIAQSGFYRLVQWFM